MARQVLENGVILPAEYSDDWYDDMTSNLTKLDDVIGSDSEKLSSADVGAAALSNNYNDLDNKPTIPTVNDATLTIQKNGVDVQTFTANASSNVTCNITVPTKTSDLTNDSNFVDTSNPAVSSGITSTKVTDYDTHIADTDIHVTTADKNRWNNQTYVFRYSSTALVASSTNSNTLLDNTDNLKVGDKVIDSSGVLFSITAIDTANSTFTVGTALIDLAQDSDVVHKSGNETVGGIKSFSDDTFIKSLNFTNEVASASSSSSAVMPLVTTVTYTDQTASQSARINLRITASGDKSLYPHENNQYALGLTSRKWSEVHGVTYYYGSSDIEFSNKFVTTDTDQAITGLKSFTGLRTEFKRVNGDGVVLFSNGNFTKGSAPNSIVTICRKYYGDATSIGSVLGYSSVSVDNNGNKTTYQFYCIDNTSGSTLRTTIQMNYDKSLSGTDAQYINISGSLLPSSDNSYNLGNSTNKWSTINGLNPSSLGMPDLSNGIDISSYISYGADRYDSTYTVPANGYITIYGICGGTASGIVITNGNYAQSSYAVRRPDLVFYAGVTMPVLAGDVVTIGTNNVTSLISAKFFPCQGNV